MKLSKKVMKRLKEEIEIRELWNETEEEVNRDIRMTVSKMESSMKEMSQKTAKHIEKRFKKENFKRFNEVESAIKKLDELEKRVQRI